MSETLHLTANHALSELGGVAAAAQRFLQQQSVGESVLYVTQLALEEILSNIIRHGGSAAPGASIAIQLRANHGAVDLHVVDEARPFDPRTAPAPDLQAPLEQRSTGGLGIPLLRALTSDMHYERIGQANHLRVRIAPPLS